MVVVHIRKLIRCLPVDYFVFDRLKNCLPRALRLKKTQMKTAARSAIPKEYWSHQSRRDGLVFN